MEYGAGRLFPFDLFLQQEQSMLHGLGPWRSPGNIHVYRQNLIHALHHAVDIVHAA
jgi:hypothetical protein